MIDCDELRRNYNEWTVEQHRDFYSRLYAEYPVQSHADAGLLIETIDSLPSVPTLVMEVGGWDGELAVTVLDRFPLILDWMNVEICQEAVEQGHRHTRYTPVWLNRWYWESVWWSDLFVASHVIEHMSAEHLDATIRATDAEHLFLDAPLYDTPTNWWGTPTTHVLEVGWTGVTDICAKHGYRLVSAVEHETAPESGGEARACLYRRDA